MTEQATPLDPRTRELTILNAVAQTLNRSVSLDAALRSTLAKAAELLNLHAGWIWLINEQTGEHYLAAAQDLPPALAADPRKMEGWCRCVEAYLEGGLAGAENIDVITCTRLNGLVEGTDGLRYHASVPIHASGKQIGILNVASADWCELSAEDLSLLYTIGDMLGIAVERARLYGHSQDLGAVNERNRLAREIHDTLAQGLSAITLQLETADALLESAMLARRLALGDAVLAPSALPNLSDTAAPPSFPGAPLGVPEDEPSTEYQAFDGARRSVQQALLLARANLDEARRSVLDLRAAPLDGRSLAAALGGLAADTTAQAVGKTLVTLSTVGGSRPLPIGVEVGLYRIAQEAVANSLRHAGARHVQITLTTTPTWVRLSVEDDGRGFDLDQPSPERFGLAGMNERVGLLGGVLHIRTARGSGAAIEATVPLEV
jgi:two-component system NarL family sensor kinase